MTGQQGRPQPGPGGGRKRPAIWSSLVADPKHGPLPALLLALTVVTGIVDAVSILALGRVFVANMTGNIVFVGFAVAGAPGFSLVASLAALAGFMAGASGGGVMVERFPSNRAELLRNTLALEVVLAAAGLVVALVAPSPFGGPTKDGIAALTALALGLQNSVARRLAVPDLTTSVLTMTLTGIAADLRRRDRVVVARRLLAVTTMLAGAVIGALLVLHQSAAAALGLATALLVAVAVMVAIAGRSPQPWTA